MDIRHPPITQSNPRSACGRTGVIPSSHIAESRLAEILLIRHHIRSQNHYLILATTAPIRINPILQRARHPRQIGIALHQRPLTYNTAERAKPARRFAGNRQTRALDNVTTLPPSQPTVYERVDVLDPRRRRVTHAMVLVNRDTKH